MQRRKPLDSEPPTLVHRCPRWSSTTPCSPGTTLCSCHCTASHSLAVLTPPCLLDSPPGGQLPARHAVSLLHGLHCTRGDSMFSKAFFIKCSREPLLGSTGKAAFITFITYRHIAIIKKRFLASFLLSALLPSLETTSLNFRTNTFNAYMPCICFYINIKLSLC